MLEDLFVQIVGKLPNTKVSGPEALAILKHVAKSGFVFAAGGDFKKDKPEYILFAFRDAYKNKEVRPVFARVIQGMMTSPTAKPQAVIRRRSQGDLGRQSGRRDLDLVGRGLEEGRPRRRDPVTRVGRHHPRDAGRQAPQRHRAPQAGRAREARGRIRRPPVWRSSTRSILQSRRSRPASGSRRSPSWISDGIPGRRPGQHHPDRAPAPRKGILALLDGPTFDRESLPPLPESLTGIPWSSMDLKSRWTSQSTLAKAFKPDVEDQVNKVVDAIKARTKLRLREDILGISGRRWPGTSCREDQGAVAAPATPSMMGMMMAGDGIDQIPSWRSSWISTTPKRSSRCSTS